MKIHKLIKLVIFVFMIFKRSNCLIEIKDSTYHKCINVGLECLVVFVNPS